MQRQLVFGLLAKLGTLIAAGQMLLVVLLDACLSVFRLALARLRGLGRSLAPVQLPLELGPRLFGSGDFLSKNPVLCVFPLQLRLFELGL